MGLVQVFSRLLFRLQLEWCVLKAKKEPCLEGKRSRLVVLTSRVTCNEIRYHTLFTEPRIFFWTWNVLKKKFSAHIFFPNNNYYEFSNFDAAWKYLGVELPEVKGSRPRPHFFHLGEKKSLSDNDDVKSSRGATICCPRCRL